MFYSKITKNKNTTRLFKIYTQKENRISFGLKLDIGKKDLKFMTGFDLVFSFYKISLNITLSKILNSTKKV
jgi:hypothetical protein